MADAQDDLVYKRLNNNPAGYQLRSGLRYTWYMSGDGWTRVEKVISLASDWRFVKSLKRKFKLKLT